jgi:hypothetical protein
MLTPQLPFAAKSHVWLNPQQPPKNLTMKFMKQWHEGNRAHGANTTFWVFRKNKILTLVSLNELEFLHALTSCPSWFCFVLALS